MEKYRRFGRANWTKAGNIEVYLNIKSWPTMQLIRKHLAEFLPDMPTWKDDNYFCEKSYFRSNFRYDGEYQLFFPAKALSAVVELFGKQPAKCR